MASACSECLRLERQRLSRARPTQQPDRVRAGVSYGLEFPKYFSTGEADREEEYTFRRSNAFDTVAGEVAAVRAGGGVGLSLAEWMIQGQPTSYPDIFAMDVARYGPWASRAYTLQKSQENYRRRFR